MRRFAVPFFATALFAGATFAVACTTNTVEHVPAPGAATATADGGLNLPGADELGKDCIAACGSGDARKCATGADGKCTSNLCLVDPTQPGTAHIAYCSLDCTKTGACPTAYHCEDIVSFGNADVTKACVADPASCGDGIVQLGELCDGTSDQGKCSSDCSKITAVCGDGHVQAGEKCDGDTAQGYCAADCKTLETPSLVLETLNTEAYLATNTTTPVVKQSNGMLMLDYPAAGDAKGCNALKVLSSDASSARVAWTTCDASGGRVTFTFSLPKVAVNYSYGKDIPAAYVASARIQDATGKDVTLGASDLSYEFSSEGDARMFAGAVGDQVKHAAIGMISFRFRRYEQSSGNYDSASFDFGYEWVVPPK